MKTVCISHAEDADGIICAAVLKHLLDAHTLLVAYDDLEEALKSVRPPVEEVYICDLNIRKELCKEVERITKFSSVTFVDHHPTEAEVIKRLQHSGVTVVYSTLDCSSVLLFSHHQEKLDWKAARLVVYAAISDHFEDGPIASKLMARLDRHFVEHEALILTHALHRKATSKFRLMVANELSKFSFPHKVEGVTEAALGYLEDAVELLETLPKKASRLEKLAYVEGVQGMTIGAVAGLLIDAMNVDVGVCYKREETGFMSISIRGQRGIELHLGEIAKRLAKRHGGFGGGHNTASGASIPRSNYIEFVKDIERELKKTNGRRE